MFRRLADMILRRPPSAERVRREKDLAALQVKSDDTLRRVDRLLGSELDGAINAIRRRPGH